ncbi:MAG: hypothetical protein EOP85_00750 [Verrucomicrobiaceae bacterium]|nr:MAG: hypothetical protein EOP85_00750 [Verrucomicrobiaceae bacterium]
MLCLPSVLRAEDKILFLGNSFTFGDGGTASVASIFDRLAIAGGHEDPTTEMRAVGGQGFQFHENDATSRSVIASQPWTHVIIQNFSTEPTHIGNVDSHMTNGSLLYNRILANNPQTRVILYQTWSRSAVHPLISGVSTASTFSSTTEMQDELRVNYQLLADSLNSTYPANPPVRIAPVGEAWQNTGALLPASHEAFRKLHGADNYHGNNNGYFLAAATIYATIYGRSPEGLHLEPAFTSLNFPLTVDPFLLERMAWETATGTAGIRYTKQPAGATVAENQPVTFSAEVLGSFPRAVQWLCDGEPIPDATALSYTVSSATALMSGSRFSVRVTNGSSSVTSDSAILTVTADEQAPVPGSPVLTNPTTVRLTFDEMLSTAPAGNPLNFTVIHQGNVVPVTAAVLLPDGFSVELSLSSPVTTGFSVVTSGEVTDLAGNGHASGIVSVSPANVPASSPMYFDFGSTTTITGPSQDTGRIWNNVTTTIGNTNTGVINPLRDASGAATTARFQMVRRFNDVNPNGTTASNLFPVPATQDSLFGNTEVWVGLGQVFPAFRLTGLDPQTTYSLLFYASRTGVADNRQTVYTVTGATVSSTSLNAANNINNVATLAAVKPSTNGEVLVELSPGPMNNNAYHFTYLNAMVVTPADKTIPVFHPVVRVGEHVILDWTGNGTLESSADLSSPWMPVVPKPTPPYSESLALPHRFFRLSYPEP